ncbi:DUF4328 domain-containing protein [Novosphingobium cyanobacteriorum]|uniref:DUF4328 domain-containing protein n=1 Tax=Novosphingobium cyanobacteriorum TaxID=3024215 RepID=A0ABT6CHZ0_9SPHN|nr:DUF4328 domain-containing protein [Novosphingobium cyanobacteriorum]MDF8332685.1 DUF4328 domain-containing protein [Novosphingobium cyanobacteriorum]
MSASLKRRAIAVQVAVGVHYAAMAAAAIYVVQIERRDGAIPIDVIATAFGGSLVPQLIAGPIVFTAFLFWLWRAVADLHVHRLPGLERSPIWAVSCWFVPGANFVAPFRTMRELWNRSAGEDQYNAKAPVTLASGWWACWIGGLFLHAVLLATFMVSAFNRARVVTSPEIAMLMLVLGQAMWHGAMIQLVLLVRRITAMQASHIYSAGVFD